ncbi:MAG TPA: ferric reductase-like transmembrane domain-containing protein [Solirubrobacteraceae bacterium]|nr:ferric reductase-like transmembrane domain-containing protein [Solirubrobacteraceae bacterium]
MTPRVDPQPYLWWLVSRASGIVALALISCSVLLGLLMATKLLRRKGLNRTLVRLHEQLALAGLVGIAVHGASLLGDHWLKPGITGILVPFAIAYRPQYTGLGIIAGYLALLLGPSYYLRRRIGTRRWRSLHRATVLVWALGVVHALGAGSDGSTVWLRALVIVTGVPIVYLFALRMLQSATRAAGRPASTPATRRAAVDHGGRSHAPRAARGKPTDNERRNRPVDVPVTDP